MDGFEGHEGIIVIAATNRDLPQMVQQGTFRDDLYYRVAVVTLPLPPLRERREDIPLLARQFLQKSAKELGVEAKRITDAALARLMGFEFPGNVRQLENVCHWLTVMAPAQVIEVKDMPPELLGVRTVSEPSSLSVQSAAPAVDSAPAPVAPKETSSPPTVLPKASRRSRLTRF